MFTIIRHKVVRILAVASLALIASGHLETEPLITHSFPVERAADAWKLIQERTEPAEEGASLRSDAPFLGVLLTWT